MPRARNLKPSFFTNDTLAEVAPLGRLLFAGLWTIADRAGRLEDRPRRIKAELLPYDDCDVNETLNDLWALGFILRYSANGGAYIQVVNFERHQNPHQNEAASVIPAPEDSDASTVQVPEKHESNPADSLNPLTDSLNRIPETSTARPRAKADSSNSGKTATSDEPKPADKPPKVSEPSSGEKPFDLVIAVCEATGVDISELSPGTKQRQSAVAKRLLEDGMTPTEAGRCATWLLSQDWRTNGVDLFTVEKERGKWAMAGKPSHAVARASPARASPQSTIAHNTAAAQEGIAIWNARGATKP